MIRVTYYMTQVLCVLNAILVISFLALGTTHMAYTSAMTLTTLLLTSWYLNRVMSREIATKVVLDWQVALEHKELEKEALDAP